MAYEHADGFSAERPLTIVTASVDRIEMKERPPIECDLVYTGGVEWVGRSSMSVGIRVEFEDKGGRMREVLTSRFTMVARDRYNKGAAPVNPLVPSNEDEKARYERARLATEARRKMTQAERAAAEVPPNVADLAEVHDLYKRFRPTESLVGNSGAAEVGTTQVRSTLLMHPQNRNIHGKIFGGYLLRTAFEQAFNTLYIFTGQPPHFSAVEDIAFVAPVEIGSILKFTSKVVYSDHPDGTAPSSQVRPAENIAMVETIATVIDPSSAKATVTNVFYFTFDTRSPKVVVPRTYDEAITYVKAKRMIEHRYQDLPWVPSKL